MTDTYKSGEEILRELYDGGASSVDEILRVVYENGGQGNAIICGPGLRFTTVAEASAFAALKYADAGEAQTVLAMPGVTRDYTSTEGVRIIYQDDITNDLRFDRLWPVSSRWDPIAAPFTWTKNAANGIACRLCYPITNACVGIQLEFGGNSSILDANTGSQSVTNAWTVTKCSIEFNGVIYPVTFDGERSVSVPADSEGVLSDFIPITLARGDVIYVRTASTTPTLGDKVGCVATNIYDAGVSTMDRSHDYDDDYIDNVAVDAAWGNQLTYPKTGPRAIWGKLVNKTRPAIALIGDSICWKGYDYNIRGHNWITELFAENYLPFIVCARSGGRGYWEYTKNKDMARSVRDADIIVCALGRNDSSGITTAAEWKARLEGLWAQLPKTARIYQTTITPYTTVANDGPVNASAIFADAVLIEMNDWIRSCPAPLAGVIDLADITMSAHNSCRWKTGYANDGLHPNATVGVPAIQEQIRAYNSVFSIEPQVDGRYIRLVRDREITVTTAANDTYVGTGLAFNIPGPCVCKGLLITATVPYGTAGGAKTIDYAVGTVANADADLSDATDIDIMVAAGAKTAASSHGDAASDHVAAYFPMDGVGAYLSAKSTTVYLNYIGKAATGGDTKGTVASRFNVWAKVEPLV